MEKKQTAIDALYYWLCINREATADEWFQAYMEAKEREKEQILTAFDEGYRQEFEFNYDPSIDYYNETYGKETDRG